MIQDKIEKIGLQANLTLEQRQYFDKLKAELVEFFQGKSYEEVLVSKDLDRLKQIKLKLDQIIQFLKDKKISQAEEDEPMWTPEQVLMWAREVFPTKVNIADFVGRNFNFGSRWVACQTEIRSSRVAFLPSNFWVYGNLLISGASITKLPKRLWVSGDCGFEDTQITELPRDFHVKGYLNIAHSEIRDLPDDLSVGGDIYVGGLPQEVIDKAKELKRRGQIKGSVFPKLS